MRIYEGSPRQDFEEVFRSIGAFIDQRGMREILLVEAPDGFIVQGVVTAGAAGGQWSEAIGTQSKETLTFLDDDIARFMEESVARRGQPGPEPQRDAGFYETALRVIGHYMDEQKPRDVFFFDTIEKLRKKEQIPPKILLTDRLFDKGNAAQYVSEAY